MAKRRVQWVGTVHAFQTFGATALDTIVSDTVFEDFTAPTIVRIRGRLIVKLNASSGAIYQATSFRFGLIVAHKSVAAGDYDVDDVNNAWLWYNSGLVWQPIGERKYWDGAAAIAYNGALGASTRKEVFEIDIKAMRKVPDNYRLVLVSERTVEAGAPNDPEFYGHFRVLVKE